MVRVCFTQNVQAYVRCPEVNAQGDTALKVLLSAFEQIPRARGYFLDEQDQLRQHVIVFIDGAPIRDRAKLSDPVPPDATVYVMQALSGG